MSKLHSWCVEHRSALWWAIMGPALGIGAVSVMPVVAFWIAATVMLAGYVLFIFSFVKSGAFKKDRA